MKRISNAEFRKQFIGWQCRIRQIAMRDYDGRPLPAMMPRVSTRKGEVLLPAMVTVLVHKEPEEVTNHFRFLVQKTHDTRAVRETGLKFLAAAFYQEPDFFSDLLIAVFPTASATSERLVMHGSVLLDFEGFGQAYRMFAAVRKLRTVDCLREAALWHNRLFNPNIAANAEVLAFAPDWKTAQAEPGPIG